LDVSLAHTFTEPTVVRRALLTEQSTIYGAPNCSPIFVEACNSRQDRYFQRIPELLETPTRVIIGRRNFPTKIAGEKVIFNKLKNYGFVEIQPESLSLHNQVSILRNARSVIFSEGSFVHWMDILGQLPGEVGFLQRRPAKMQGTAHQISLVRSRFQTHKFSGDPDFQLSAIVNDTTNSIGIYRVNHMLNFIEEAVGLRISLIKNLVIEYLEEVENDAYSLYQYFEKKRSISNRLRDRADFEVELSKILKSIGS
jgi:hypothetical protein